jgi:hypothetical protein
MLTFLQDFFTHIKLGRQDVTVARKIGIVVTEVLEYTPGKFYVERYVRPKYLPPKKKESLSENFPFCHKR